MSGAISKDNPLMNFAQTSTAATTLAQSEKIVRDNLNAIEVAGGNGRTPFAWAAGVTGAYNLAYALLKAGANPNVTYMLNKTIPSTVLSELIAKTNVTNADTYIMYLINRSTTGLSYPTFEDFLKSMKISNGVKVLFAPTTQEPARVSGPSAARVSGPSAARVSGASAAIVSGASAAIVSGASAARVSGASAASAAPVAAPVAAPAPPATPTGIPLYSLEYMNDPKFFKENGIENSQIVVKRFPGPHKRSDREERENLYKNPDGSLINPVKNGMTVTWKNGSAKVLGSHIANNPIDGMVNKVLYITLDKGVDINEKVFYLQPSGGYRKKSRKRRRTRKSKQTKRR